MIPTEQFSGALYPKEILEGIVDLAREFDLLLFSDEIYDRLVMDGLTHIPLATLAPDRMVVTLNGLSKVPSSSRLSGRLDGTLWG